MDLAADDAAPGDRALAARLTVADVEGLRRNRSADSRAAIAAKFGAQLDELTRTGRNELVDAVLGLLLGDVERTVRRALAEAVAASPNLPPEVAERLATDEAIEVARPVLEGSPVLRDRTLIDVVRTHAMQYALAVAGRAVLSEMVADALVETGQPPVVERLVGNAGAELSRRALNRIIRDYRDHREIQVRLVGRPLLPHDLLEQLVDMVGERLQWNLVASRMITLGQAHAIMAAAQQRAAADWAGGGGTGAGAAPGQGPQEGGGFGRRHLAGALDPERVLAFLRDGEMRSFEAGIASLAGVGVARARRLLYGADRRQLAALCVRAGFGTGHYTVLRMAIDLAEQCLSTGGRTPPYPKDALDFVRDQYERLRQQPDLVAELVGE